MAVTRTDVEKVALLSRLLLSEGELDAATRQLADVVHYVDQLSEVDTTGVAPMAHAVELSNVLKDDRVAASLPRNEALANAPRKNAQGYLVPAVLGD